MNAIRATALAAAMLVLAACDGGTTTKPPSYGPRLAPYSTNEWVDLPPSPLGTWPNYGWVYLADGSGFVQAGGAKARGSKLTTTKRAAIFSFSERRYRRLPDLPVNAGVGSPSGARIGDRLVIIGQDCPPLPPPSDTGVEFCAAEGAGAKVVLTTTLGDDHWTKVDAPTWLRDFRWGSPTVLGVRHGRVIVAAGETNPTLAAFDPATVRWTRIEQPTTGSYEIRCLVNDDILGYPGLLSVGAAPLGTARLSVLRDGAWQPVALPDAATINTIVCARHGIWLVHDTTNYQPEPGQFRFDWTVSYFDPVSGVETIVRPHQRRNFYAIPGSTYGDTLIKGGPRRTVVLTPERSLTIPVGGLAGNNFLALVGPYLISESEAKIMRLDVG